MAVVVLATIAKAAPAIRFCIAAAASKMASHVERTTIAPPATAMFKPRALPTVVRATAAAQPMATAVVLTTTVLAATAIRIFSVASPPRASIVPRTPLA
jgi:hypothetical protein